MCKQRGFYQKANTVHHVQYVRNHPRLALSRAYTFQGIEHENLLPLCHNCHEEIHNHRVKIQKEYLTEEKW